MPRPDRAFAEWVGIIDAASERTNTNLERLLDLWDRDIAHRLGLHNPPDLLIAVGVNIALQLAYQNTVAAADFYMSNQLWINDEGGPE